MCSIKILLINIRANINKFRISPINAASNNIPSRLSLQQRKVMDGWVTGSLDGSRWVPGRSPRNVRLGQTAQVRGKSGRISVASGVKGRFFLGRPSTGPG